MSIEMYIENLDTTRAVDVVTRVWVKGEPGPTVTARETLKPRQGLTFSVASLRDLLIEYSAEDAQ